MSNGLNFFEFVPESRKYWFLRTQGGAFYDEFASKGYVAIGWTKIEDPKRLLSMKRADAISSISELYPNEKRPGKIYNQLNRFYKNMRVDDVVMIPSDSSSKIRFGIIKSEPYTISKDQIDNCPHLMRRTVEWVKTVDRDRLDPQLYRMTRPQNTISDASEYAPYIDRTIGSLFVKGNKAHMVIPIKTKEDISAVDLYDFMDLIFKTIPIVNEADILETKYSREDLDIKLNLQSPGLLEYISHHAELMFGIGTVLVFVVGGSFAAKFTKESKEVNANSDGLLGKMFDFIVKRKDQEIEIMKLKKEHEMLQAKLDYQLPKEIESPTQETLAEDPSPDTEMKSE